MITVQLNNACLINESSYEGFCGFYITFKNNIGTGKQKRPPIRTALVYTIKLRNFFDLL